MAKNKLIAATVAAVVGVGMSMSAAAAQAQQYSIDKLEKCYGISKAGKNDCATKTHACAGQATANNDVNEWTLVPKGSCVKMGGSLVAGQAGKKSSNQ